MEQPTLCFSCLLLLYISNLGPCIFTVQAQSTLRPRISPGLRVPPPPPLPEPSSNTTEILIAYLGRTYGGVIRVTESPKQWQDLNMTTNLRPVDVSFGPDDALYVSEVSSVKGVLKVQRNTGGGISTVQRSFSSASVIDGIVYDKWSNLVYYTDTGLDEIGVVTANLRSKYVLITKETTPDLHQPRAIKVFPSKGLMFWTDWGNNASIWTAHMNGNNSRAIITTNLVWPNGMDVDYEGEGKLYWCDGGTERIESANLDGTDRRLVHKGFNFLSHYFGLAVAGDYLYYTNWRVRVLMRINKRGGREDFFQPLRSEKYFRLSGIHARTPAGTVQSGCGGLDNGGCTEMCLAKPGGVDCVCPSKKDALCSGPIVFQPEQHTFDALSDSSRPFILVAELGPPDFDDPSPSNLTRPRSVLASLDRGYIVHYDTITGKGKKLGFPLPLQPQSMVYIPAGVGRTPFGRIAVSEATRIWVSRPFQYSGIQYHRWDTVELSVDSIVTSLSLDLSTGNVYFVDRGVGEIGVLELSSFKRRTLYRSTTAAIIDLVLVPASGLMYWTDDEPDTMSGSVWKANMDGTNVERLYFAPHEESAGIDYDHENGKLYWVSLSTSGDGTLNFIRSIDVATNTSTLILSVQSRNYHGLAHQNGYLYVSGWQSSRMFRIEPLNKTTTAFGYVEDVPVGHARPLDIFTSKANYSSVCSVNNGGCSSFCLPISSTKRACHCPDDDPSCCPYRPSLVTPAPPPSFRNASSSTCVDPNPELAVIFTTAPTPSTSTTLPSTTLSTALSTARSTTAGPSTASSSTIVTPDSPPSQSSTTTPTVASTIKSTLPPMRSSTPNTTPVAPVSTKKSTTLRTTPTQSTKSVKEKTTPKDLTTQSVYVWSSAKPGATKGKPSAHKQGSDGKSNTAVSVGVPVAILCLVAIIVVAVLVVRWRKRKYNTHAQLLQNEEMPEEGPDFTNQMYHL